MPYSGKTEILKVNSLRKGLEAVKGREKRLIFLPRSWR